MWQAKSACYHLCSISKWNNASEWLKIIPWVDSNFTARFRSNNTLAVYMRSVMSLFLIPLVSGADVILIIYYLSVVSQIILVLDIPLVWLTYKNISCLYFRNFNTLHLFMDSNYCKRLFPLFTEEQIYLAQKKQHEFNAQLNTYFEELRKI